MTLNQHCYVHTVWAVCTATFLSVCSVIARADAPAVNTPDVSAAQQLTVRFTDLNLSVPQGAETLYARIRGAANQVCGPQDDRNLVIFGARRACIEKAIADAVAHVGNAQLRAVYEAHRGLATRVPAVVRR